MCIDLRCLQAGMAEELPYLAKGHTALKQMGSDAVPQGMQAAPPVYTRLPCKPAQPLGKALALHTVARPANE